MKSYLFLCALLFMACNRPEYIGRVNRIRYDRWRNGMILKYELSFIRDGHKDTTMLIGNRIHEKGSDGIFYFEEGDSICFKYGGFEYLNSFVRIHRLAPRKSAATTKIIKKEELSVGYGVAMNHLDTVPMLPNAKSNADNERFVGELVKSRLHLKNDALLYLRIDTCGKATFFQCLPPQLSAAEEAKLKAIIEGLPFFTPGYRDGKKVASVVYYRILKSESDVK